MTDAADVDGVAAEAALIRRMPKDDFDAWLRQPKRHMHPVIIPDLCSHWPAMQWTTRWLRERFGNRPVPYDDRETPLAEALDRIEASTPEAPAPYLFRCHLEKYLPELIADIQPIPGAALNRLNTGIVRHPEFHMGLPELLVAGPGTRFPRLHCDIFNLHTVITQVRGDKEFIFHPPNQTPFLYPIADNRNFSAIDRFDPVDENRWPEYRGAKPIRVTVREGESIFISSLWWHRTLILDKVSIAVTWDLLTRSNWNDYVDYRFCGGAHRSAAKAAKIFVYRNLFGAALDLREAAVRSPRAETHSST